MPKRTKDYNEWLLKRLSDPQYAERYLRTAKADSNEMFLKAVRKVAEAKKMAKVAEQAGVNRESLYKTLSPEGNPEFFTIEAVLNAVGMTLVPQLLKSPATSNLPPSGGKFTTATITVASTTTTNTVVPKVGHEEPADYFAVPRSDGLQFVIVSKKSGNSQLANVA